MNYITSQALKFQLDSFQKNLITKQKSSNLTTLKQLIRTETTKLLQDLPKGVDKNQLLTLLEGIFGSKNFQDGKYKGGREVVLETVQEFFGKENFKNGKFQGGWNEQQDTANLQKVFKPENFTNGEYTGGWNKTQDQQNLKQSLTNGEAKTLTSQLIEEKLGGSEKFQEGVYQSEAEIIKVAEKALENKGPLLRKLRNIIGEKEFFAEEPGDGIPPGREGMRVDPEAIALQQAEQKARIEAIEKWREFYEDHSIVDSNEKLFWSNKFGSSVRTAEGIYKDAILKAAEIVGEDKPLNDLEKNQINKATTPDKIKAVLEDIPKQRRIKEWNNFFEKHDLLNNIDPSWRENWTKSNLSIEVAKLIYNNGWYNSPKGLIGNDKKIATYTTETTVDGKDYEKTIQKIDPLKYLAPEVKKAHDFIVKRIDLETNLTKFPTDEEINKEVYDETKVPDTISYEKLRKLKHDRIVDLFKQYFQEKKPATSLKDNEIELWRTSPTGLPNTGKDQRLAFDNGWITPSEITETKTKYEGIENIAVLKVKKVDIDNEILKVKELVKQINAYRYLRDLDANQANIDKQFAELKTDLLPPNKAQEIKEAEQKQREKLYYYLTDPKDGGIEETTLKRLEKNLENKWEVPNYEPITIDMLNKLIVADKDVQDLQLLQDGVGHEDLTKSGWLEEKKGYVIPKKFTEPEEDLHRDQKGAFLLSFFYDKARDGNNRAFDPTDLDQENSFCRMGIDKVPKIEKDWKGKKTTVMVEKEVIGGNKGMAGHLAIGTGVGKTTKLINCLVSGGKRHIILVCPTVGLMESAFKHHTSWLQKWGCVYCGKEKSQTSMEFCRQGTFTKATDEEIAKGKADKEKQEIYISHGAYPVAKNDLAYWKDANTGQFGSKEEGQKGLSVMFFGNLLGTVARNLFEESGGVNSWSDNNEKQKVKEKLIPKEDTIVVFDEAHFNNAGYQALQFEMIKAGYKCLRMSATFPKTPFSATSTYHMTRMFSGKLDPKMPAGLMKIDNAEQAEIIEEMRGAKIGSIKFKTEKGLPIFIEVSLEERIRAGKTWYFSKSLQLNPEQLDALGINTKYTIYGEQYDENCEDVSYGQPYGSLGIVDGRREMGYTPDVDTVICSGITETKNLGNYFSYSDPVVGFTPISSLVQQMGRCARVKPGLAITLTKESMEMDLSDNVSAAMVKACFDGNTKQINEKDYKQIYDIDILRGALAYPSSKTFGKAPEEILMGLKVSEKQIKGKVKLDKLEWRQDTKEDEKEAKAVPWYSSVKPDDELWGRYLGRDEKVPMKPEVALKTLKEMIANFIIQDGSFPQGLDMKKQEKMIGVVLGEKLGSDKGKEEIVRETRKVLNGLVKTKKDELGSKDYDGGKKCSKNPNTIRKLAGLYKLTDANVDYKRLKNDEGEEVWTLLMNTPIPAQA